MRGAVLYGPRDVRIDDRPAPTIIEPTDAVIRLSATCICGSPASATSPCHVARVDGRSIDECPGGYVQRAALRADSDLAHEPDDIVEKVLFDDLSVVPARNRAEVHLE